PRRVARVLGAVGKGGVLGESRRVERIERPDRGVLYSDPGEVAGDVELSPAVWAFLRQALWAVVNDGTGIAAKIPGIDIAGKTGTAQMVAHSKAEKGQDHAWFAAFAPVRDAEVVVVVLVEPRGTRGQAASRRSRR